MFRSPFETNWNFSDPLSPDETFDHFNQYNGTGDWQFYFFNSGPAEIQVEFLSLSIQCQGAKRHLEDKFNRTSPVHDRFMFEWAPRATFDLSIPDAGLCED